MLLLALLMVLNFIWGQLPSYMATLTASASVLCKEGVAEGCRQRKGPASGSRIGDGVEQARQSVQPILVLFTSRKRPLPALIFISQHTPAAASWSGTGCPNSLVAHVAAAILLGWLGNPVEHPAGRCRLGAMRLGE